MASKTQPKSNKSGLSVAKVIPYILVIGGIIGWIAAAIITQDKFDLLKNPNFIPSCDLNPIVSCGSVMQSTQSHVFGFSNTFIGLAGFPILLTIGMAIFAGGKFKRWFWLGLQTGLTIGLAFAYWLLFQSVYHIHALCPYCLAVDVVMIVTTWYITLYNVDQGYFRLPAGRPKNMYAWIRRHHLDILILWFLIVIGLILKHFWYYYGHYF